MQKNTKELTREQAIKRFGIEVIESGDSSIQDNASIEFWSDLEDNSYQVQVVGENGKGIMYILLS